MSAYTPQELQAVAAGATAAPNEVLTLCLGAEEYGVDVLRVQEIPSYEQPTRMDGAPARVMGVTNRRSGSCPSSTFAAASA